MGTEKQGHTPGPWKLLPPQPESDGSVYPASIVGGSRELTICTFGDNWESDVMCEAPGDNRSKRANAALIAAAPDLLAALRPLVAIVNGARVHRLKRAGYLEVARAAIRKARGE